ncbi:S-layer homology domain-containing protein [Paenibacillus hamazuiensis]|uniref:S-layer homology domain-containing protein n=1 Tax=Paenibacillus hamazuiensis TaxID=2936508 RepID=UPI00200D466F|nr:S-layer homology domain-containing protein [Paenibacillus hamazuiensis]
MARSVRRCSLILSLCIALTLILPYVPAGAAAQVKFTDVDPTRDAWAYNSIYAMAQKGVLTGYEDGRFRPEQPVSKAEWTVMVARLFDKYRPNLNAAGTLRVPGYADVSRLHWAYKEITDMYDYSFPIGTYWLNWRGDLTFRPDAALTRLQLAQMLYGFFDNRLMDRRMSESDVCSVMQSFKDIPMQIYTDTDDYDDARKGDGRYTSNGGYSDDYGRVFVTLFMSKGADDCRFGTDEFSNMQATALTSLHANGIMTAKDLGYFRPLDKVTRAEAVTILERIYNYLRLNGWVNDYTTVDLSATLNGGGSGVPSGSGAGSGPSGGTGGWPAGSPGTGSSPVLNPGDADGATNFTVRDYFDENGTITKDLMKDGEIVTAVDIGDNKFLTINLKSKEKVDLHVLINGQVGFLKQEELPITLPVDGVQQVWLRTQLRDPKPNKVGDFTATLSVALSKEEPVKTKPSSKQPATKK